MLNAAPFKCVICGDNAKQLMQHPMSALHFEVPVVIDFAQPVCGKGSCDVKARQERRKEMSDVEEIYGLSLVDRVSFFCGN